MRALVVNDYASSLAKRGDFESIASKLAPTGFSVTTQETERTAPCDTLVGCSLNT